MTRPAGEITRQEYILFSHKSSLPRGVQVRLVLISRQPITNRRTMFQLQQRILLEFDELLDV